MYKKQSVAVVVPAFNEENQITGVVNSMPEIVDRIIVVDDGSSDGTAAVLKELARECERLVVISHERNGGVGAAIATGYKWARDNDLDLVAVMAGDGQMAPEDLTSLLDPVAEGDTDYAKGNRLIYENSFKQIPSVRFFGNMILSFLTKIASGYWHVADSQTGYTVIGKTPLHVIDWDKMYKRYGQPNDLLVRLNVHSFRVQDVPITPVYNVGEKSGIKVRKVVFTIGWLLVRLFFWRMKEKYIIRDFHPLVLFYMAGLMMLFLGSLMTIRFFYKLFETGTFPEVTALTVMFCVFTGFQSLFFAMWFDSQYDRS